MTCLAQTACSQNWVLTEKERFKEGIVRGPQKRKRDDGEDSGSDNSEDEDGASRAGDDDAGKTPKKKKNYGPKGPNPLAVKKAKKVAVENPRKEGKSTTETPAEVKPKRKRRKKAGATAGADDDGERQKQPHDAIAPADSSNPDAAAEK